MEAVLIKIRPAARVPAWAAWLPLFALPAVCLVLCPPGWPRWAVMWLLAATVYSGFKWLTWCGRSVRSADWQRSLVYLFAWPGLNADAFLSDVPTCQPLTPSRWEWAAAWLKTILGAVLIWGFARQVTGEHALLRGWIGMVGLVLVLHFGLFHLMSCFWRARGLNAPPLMNAPLRASNLSDFWARRWNIAFRDVTHRHVFRPVAAQYGSTVALWAVFLLSGLVHDLGISVPAQAGYGWPTAYFALQAAGILIERSGLGRAIGLGNGWRGRLFTAMVLLAPLGWLFHPPFVRDVIVPFLKVLGA